MSSTAQGFLLITLSNAKLSAPFFNPPEQVGVLALECVTIAVSPRENPFGTGPDKDVWLVLRHNNFELPLSAADTIYHSRINNTFTFKSPDGPVVAALPPPMTSGAAEDIETFEVLLAQYGVLQQVDPTAPGDDGDLKGRLVLVDEDDGNIVGTLGEGINIREDPNVREPGREKEPIVVELPDEGSNDVYVHSIDPDESDFILRSALFVSRGIVFATDMLAKGMSHATDYYVQNNTPNPQPMVFSETTRSNVRRIHNISGTAVSVTSKTTGMIHSMVDKLGDRLGGRASTSGTPKATPHRSMTYAPGYNGGQNLPPPLPYREKGEMGSGRTSPSFLSTTSNGPPPLPPRKPKLLNRLLISTDLILSTLENSAHTLVTHGTQNASRGLGHKYGQDMGDAALMVGQTARNVGVVYIDARGVGRRALIKKVGKKAIKGRIGSRPVVFGEQINADGTISAEHEWGTKTPSRSGATTPNTNAGTSTSTSTGPTSMFNRIASVVKSGIESRVPQGTFPGGYPGDTKKY